MKTIWILGAGASKAHNRGMPAIDEFFSIAQNLGIIIDSKNNFPILKKYIKNSFGKNILDNNIKLDIEKVLTNIEIDIEKSDSVKFLTAKQEVLKLIKEVFNGLSKGLENQKGKYEIFINGEKNYDGIKASDTILSFNWDLLLDNIFERRKILKPSYMEGESPPQSIKNKVGNNQYYKMVYELSALKGCVRYSNVSPPYERYDNSKGYYLKLHGSIDWLYCSNKSCKGFGKSFPVLNYHKTHFCSECNKELDYLIIPPVLNKQYNTYPFIDKIWNIASREIETAKKIIIWGYSLPNTDFYSDWLLRQARDSIEELILINPEYIINSKNEKKEWNYEFINKFFNIFKPNLNRTDKKFKFDMYEYFTDFINNNQVYKKYSYLKKEKSKLKNQ